MNYIVLMLKYERTRGGLLGCLRGSASGSKSAGGAGCAGHIGAVESVGHVHVGGGVDESLDNGGGYGLTGSWVSNRAKQHRR